MSKIKILHRLTRGVSFLLLLCLSLQCSNIAYAVEVSKARQSNSFYYPFIKPNSIQSALDMVSAQHKNDVLALKAKGRVIDYWLNPIIKNSSIIFLIEDAHSNVRAQRNIAAIVDGLSDEWGVREVYSEGGVGDCSLDELKAIAPNGVWKMQAPKYLNQNLIRGEELCALLSKNPPRLKGLEDLNLYKACAQSYMSVVSLRKDALSALERVERTMLILKELCFSDSMKRYESLSRESDIKAIEWASKNTGISLTRYPSLSLLVQLSRSDMRFDPKQLNQLLQKLCQEYSLRSQQGPELARHHSVDAVNAQLQILTDFRRQVKSSGFDQLRRYGLLWTFTAHLRSLSRVVADDYDEQKNSFEYDVYKRWSESLKDSDRTQAVYLCEMSLVIALTKKAIKTQLLNHEHDTLLRLMKESSWYRRVAILNSLCMQRDKPQALINVTGDLENIWSAIERFYTLVSERDKIFIGKLSQASQRPVSFSLEDSENIAVIVGGYHSRRLRMLMKQQGISYVCIRPYVQSENNLALYEKNLSKDFGFDQRARLRVSPLTGDESITNQFTLREALLGSLEIGHGVMSRLKRVAHMTSLSVHPSARRADAVAAAVAQSMMVRKGLVSKGSREMAGARMSAEPIINPQNMDDNLLRLQIERSLPSGFLGWRGEYKRIIAEELFLVYKVFKPDYPNHRIKQEVTVLSHELRRQSTLWNRFFSLTWKAPAHEALLPWAPFMVMDKEHFKYAVAHSAVRAVLGKSVEMKSPSFLNAPNDRVAQSYAYLRVLSYQDELKDNVWLKIAKKYLNGRFFAYAFFPAFVVSGLAWLGVPAYSVIFLPLYWLFVAKLQYGLHLDKSYHFFVGARAKHKDLNVYTDQIISKLLNAVNADPSERSEKIREFTAHYPYLDSLRQEPKPLTQSGEYVLSATILRELYKRCGPVVYLALRTHRDDTGVNAGFVQALAEALDTQSQKSAVALMTMLVPRKITARESSPIGQLLSRQEFLQTFFGSIGAFSAYTAASALLSKRIDVARPMPGVKYSRDSSDVREVVQTLNVLSRELNELLRINANNEVVLKPGVTYEEYLQKLAWYLNELQKQAIVLSGHSGRSFEAITPQALKSEGEFVMSPEIIGSFKKYFSDRGYFFNINFSMLGNRSPFAHLYVQRVLSQELVTQNIDFLRPSQQVQLPVIHLGENLTPGLFVNELVVYDPARMICRTERYSQVYIDDEAEAYWVESMAREFESVSRRSEYTQWPMSSKGRDDWYEVVALNLYVGAHRDLGIDLGTSANDLRARLSEASRSRLLADEAIHIYMSSQERFPDRTRRHLYVMEALSTIGSVLLYPKAVRFITYLTMKMAEAYEQGQYRDTIHGLDQYYLRNRLAFLLSKNSAQIEKILVENPDDFPRLRLRHTPASSVREFASYDGITQSELLRGLSLLDNESLLALYAEAWNELTQENNPMIAGLDCGEKALNYRPKYGLDNKGRYGTLASVLAAFTGASRVVKMISERLSSENSASQLKATLESTENSGARLAYASNATDIEAWFLGSLTDNYQSMTGGFYPFARNANVLAFRPISFGSERFLITYLGQSHDKPIPSNVSILDKPSINNATLMQERNRLRVSGVLTNQDKSKSADLARTLTQVYQTTSQALTRVDFLQKDLVFIVPISRQFDHPEEYQMLLDNVLASLQPFMRHRASIYFSDEDIFFQDMIRLRDGQLLKLDATQKIVVLSQPTKEILRSLDRRNKNANTSENLAVGYVPMPKTFKRERHWHMGNYAHAMLMADLFSLIPENRIKEVASDPAIEAFLSMVYGNTAYLNRFELLTTLTKFQWSMSMDRIRMMILPLTRPALFGQQIARWALLSRQHTLAA